MTHQPPVPHASQSPYPLHPAPHASGPDTAPTPPKRETASAHIPATGQLLAIGAALLGSAALAWYYGRDKSPPAPNGKTRRTATPNRTADRKRVAAGQPYELAYFARKHGIDTATAREIIKQAGTDRAKANALAAARKG